MEYLTQITLDHTLLLNKGNEKVTCLSLNCRSLVNKSELIGQILREEKADFALLTETWYSDNKQHQYESSDLNQNGYKISVVNRKNRVGGGIAVTCRSGVKMRRLSFGTSQTFEIGIWQLILKNITVNVVGIYRSPTVSTPAQFVADFFEFMENTLPKYTNILIMGDFNLHIIENSATILEFKNSSAMGLSQHGSFSTHTAGQSLDLVITEATNGVEILSCEPRSFVSDHCVVKSVFNVQKESITSKTVEFRNFKQIDHDEFSTVLTNILVESDNINSYVNQFEAELELVLDKHAPLTQKTVICRAPKPWFSADILRLKRLLCKAERVWRRYRQPH